MAQYERPSFGRTATTGTAASIDQGLRAYMNRVYGLMAGGVALSGVVAYAIANTPALAQAIYGTPLRWVVMLAPLAFIFLIGFRAHKMSESGALATFWAFAGVMGASLGMIFLVFTGAQITQAFLITAIAFMAMAGYGYVTQKSLSGWGSFLFMGVIGLILASLLNLFMQSSALQFAISALGVLIFAGLTAYDSQRLKNEYLYLADADGGAAYMGKSAIFGALSMYLNFINMFQSVLSLMGIMGGDE
ncbi:Bax inhibitor-1/YccA family protein [Neomegalonema sp.]|uniref:Bax inhibitor-1/YccA family protein n=1 Tax=Neomegalonema sp. TaxID=2039713 RepID=UPI0026239DC2|nr:Bax inhibitor-1/YccA family protein [Neomegalonema sp.]MDD2867663.1 Bax inhibitor-1/YccA family protein [Neomegalonema sp.]